MDFLASSRVYLMIYLSEGIRIYRALVPLIKTSLMLRVRRDTRLRIGVSQ